MSFTKKFVEKKGADATQSIVDLKEKIVALINQTVKSEKEVVYQTNTPPPIGKKFQEVTRKLKNFLNQIEDEVSNIGQQLR